MQETLLLEEPQHDEAHGTNAALWAAVLLGPIAWGLHLQVVYAAAQQTCEGDLSMLALHIMSAGFLVAAMLAGVLAAWHWLHVGNGAPSEHEMGLSARRRFLSLEGVLSSALFALVIVAQWLALVYLSPCPI